MDGEDIHYKFLEHYAEKCSPLIDAPARTNYNKSYHLILKVASMKN